MEPMKYCKFCDRTLPISEFSKDKHKADGLCVKCKSCVSAYHKRYYEERGDYVREKANQYYLEHRDEKLEYQDQYRQKNPDYMNSYRSENKEKIDKRRKEYNAQHRNEINARANRRYAKKHDEIRTAFKEQYAQNPAKYLYYQHARNALMKETVCNFTDAEWHETLDYFGSSCAYCGANGITLEQDHVIPLTKGGDYVKSNIVPACKSCNSSKGNKDLDEWYSSRAFYDPAKHKSITNFIRVNTQERNT